MSKQKKTINWREFTSRGGKTTLNRYGRSHFADMGKKGAETKRRRYGNDYFKKLARAGVEARLKKKQLAEERKNKVTVESFADILNGRT